MSGSNKLKRYTDDGGWGGLIPDLLVQIKRRLPLPDLIRFSCVCTCWRSLSSAEICHRNRLPWLIVPYVVDNSSPPGKHHNYCRDGVLGFYSILDGQTYKVEVPELYERRVCGTSYGWLITVHANSEMQLLHPFTREVLNLPPLTEASCVRTSGVYGEQDFLYFIYGCLGYQAYGGWNLSPEDMRDFHMTKVITTCKPNSVSHPLVAVCITEQLANMYFCRHGEDSYWTRIDCHSQSYSDLAIYKGSLYALRASGKVDLVMGLDGFSPPTVSLFASKPKVIGHIDDEDSYLVSSSTELLLIVRFYSAWIKGEEGIHKEYDEYRVTERFRVFKLRKRKWVEIKSLGDRAVFLGFNESVSLVASEFPGCKANSIYFSDDTKHRTCRGHDRGIYSLDDGTIEKINPIDSKYVCPRPIWYTANHD